MENGAPHEQWLGSLGGSQSQPKQRASRKACLCRENPWDLMGSVVSHVDAPFSDASSAAFLSFGGNEFLRVMDCWYCYHGSASWSHISNALGVT